MPAKKSKSDKSLIALRSRQNIGHNKVLCAATVARVERRYQVVRMRRDGYSMPEIAKTLGCDTSTVRQDLVECLSTALTELAETSEEARQIEVERLDNLVKVYTPLATEVLTRQVIDKRSGNAVIVTEPPDPAYATILLNVAARRSKLLALDVPEVKKQEETAVRVYVGINVEDM
jgi:uncharacterized protein YerC